MATGDYDRYMNWPGLFQPYVNPRQSQESGLGGGMTGAPWNPFQRRRDRIRNQYQARYGRGTGEVPFAQNAQGRLNVFGYPIQNYGWFGRPSPPHPLRGLTMTQTSPGESPLVPNAMVRGSVADQRTANGGYFPEPVRSRNPMKPGY